jgi:hypothetical protein
MAVPLLRQPTVAHVVARYDRFPLTMAAGPIYTAQACGAERADGLWEGWLEFVPHDGSIVLRSQRETTQPSLADLQYWAAGLTPVYLEGALERTVAPRPVAAPSDTRSVYEEPALREAAAAVAAPVLDPFSVYAKGEELLYRQLTALSQRHLRAIVVGYDLADPSDVDLDALSVPELIGLIVSAVRERLAA